MSEQPTFIERHGAWTDEQRRRAEEIKRRLEADKLRYVRLAWGDTHGYSRAKTLTVPAFLSALTSGYNIGVATTTLDSAGARVFASFTRGGGMGLDEMTGSPNLTLVPDPATFRMLPWAPGVGWILCDEYFNDGRPFHFSPRQLLRKTLQKLADRGCASVIGAEIEWYLLRVADDHLSEDNIGMPGLRGRPIRTWPAEPGYHYHSESNMDLMQPVFDALSDAFEALGLGLRSIENEWGPGQVECTFAPLGALAAADNTFLFRTATRQICRRLGYFATFMCRPALKGYYASGWHLHHVRRERGDVRGHGEVIRQVALGPVGGEEGQEDLLAHRLEVVKGLRLDGPFGELHGPFVVVRVDAGVGVGPVPGAGRPQVVGRAAFIQQRVNGPGRGGRGGVVRLILRAERNQALGRRLDDRAVGERHSA